MIPDDARPAEGDIVMEPNFRHEERCGKAEGRAGVLAVLTEALSTKDVRLKRRCMACLGELLFYVAAMPGEARDAACWDVQDATLSAIAGLLGPAEDSTVQVLAVSVLVAPGICVSQTPDCLPGWMDILGHSHRKQWGCLSHDE